MLFTAIVGAISQAQAAQNVCANNVTGDITAKAKCKANETPLNMNLLAGIIKSDVQEFAGLDIGSCRTVMSDGAASHDVTSTASALVTCGPGEFLLNYGYSLAPPIAEVARSSEVKYIGNVPAGASVITQSEISLIAAGVQQPPYTLRVTGTCCPSRT